MAVLSQKCFAGRGGMNQRCFQNPPPAKHLEEGRSKSEMREKVAKNRAFKQSPKKY
jgi:hypothetical protein